MTRHRVDDYPMNNVDDDAQDFTAMVKRSPSESESISSSHSSRNKKKPLDDGEEHGGEGAEEEDEKDLLVYYARNSTMHGIPSIVGSKLYRGRHVFWMGIVGMMALFLGFVIYSQMKDYYDYPTVTSVDINYVTEDDFPAVTICDPNVFHGWLVGKAGLSNYTVYQLAKLTEIEGLYHVYAKRFLAKEKDPPQKDGTDTVKEMEKLLKVYKYFIGSPRYNPFYCSWGDYYWTKCPMAGVRVTNMGVCATLDVRMLMNMTIDTTNVTDIDEIQEMRTARAIGNFMRGLTFYLDTVPVPTPYRLFKNQGFKVILHDYDQEPLPLSNGINIMGNANVEVDVTKNVKVGLPPPFKAFGTATCVDTNPEYFENPLLRFPNYTKEVCELECFIDFSVEQCGGCKHFLHPGNESLCPLDHLADCYRDAQQLYFGGHRGKAKCHCPLPCKQVNFKGAVTTMGFVETNHMQDLKKLANNTAEHVVSYIHIYYSDPVVTTKRQVAIYSTEGLLGSIGGQIGLFMGFSLVTVAEMLELLFLLATRGRKLDEHVKRQKDAHNAAEAAVQAA